MLKNVETMLIATTSIDIGAFYIGFDVFIIATLSVNIT